MLFDKSSFSTGSLSEFNIESYKIYTDLQKEYKDTSVNKVRIFARDRYPQKSPTNLFPEESVSLPFEPVCEGRVPAAPSSAQLSSMRSSSSFRRIFFSGDSFSTRAEEARQPPLLAMRQTRNRLTTIDTFRRCGKPEDKVLFEMRII